MIELQITNYLCSVEMLPELAIELLKPVGE